MFSGYFRTLEALFIPRGRSLPGNHMCLLAVLKEVAK
jgi:hypothetical protein